MGVSAERLTTGLRINSAADDAAGLAIASRMSSQINGTNQAVRNANDGISLVQTMDGAAEEVSNMLQRMRELAVQSANGTYESKDRTLMQVEYTALKDEVTRVGNTTSFNGTKLFDNSVTSVNIVADWKGTANGNVKIDFEGLVSLALTLAASGATLATVTGALIAVGKLDTGIETLNTARAGWGAVQNRLEYTVANLQNLSENMTAARSQIQDADFAAETANLARTQVLQQAGMSMMAKANQNAQMVTQLLQ
jgi:flagellin